MPISVAEQSKAQICGHSIAGVAGSYLSDSVDDHLLCLLCR
jgi:hypothetical protein